MTIRRLAFLALLISIYMVAPVNADCGADFVALAQARGDSGFYHMNDACAEESGGSRLCTLREVVQSAVHPNYPSEGVQMWVWDETVNADTACDGWRGGPSGMPIDYPAYGGVVIDPSGNIDTAFCNQTMFVACCQPRCCCPKKLKIRRTILDKLRPIDQLPPQSDLK